MSTPRILLAGDVLDRLNQLCNAFHRLANQQGVGQFFPENSDRLEEFMDYIDGREVLAGLLNMADRLIEEIASSVKMKRSRWQKILRTVLKNMIQMELETEIQLIYSIHERSIMWSFPQSFMIVVDSLGWGWWCNLCTWCYKALLFYYHFKNLPEVQYHHHHLMECNQE